MPGTIDEHASIYEELLAVHAIMRRGTQLLTDALTAPPAPGGDGRPCVELGTWLVDFVRHHHRSEDELFWPELRAALPGRERELDDLTAQHEELEEALGALAGSLATGLQERSAASGGAGRQRVRDITSDVQSRLTAHLDSEEPVLRVAMTALTPETIRRLRRAVAAGAPRTGPDLVIGLMSEPTPVPGAADLMRNLPPPLRLVAPLLRSRYRRRLRRLGVAGPR